MTDFHPRLKTGGFSLIELAIVITVIGAILGGVWMAAGTARDYTKRQQMVQDLGTTLTNIRNFYAGQGGLPAVSFSVMSSNLITNNLIPGDLVRGVGVGCTNPGGTCADTVWGSTAAGAMDPNGTFRVCNWTLGLVAPSTGCTAAPPAVGVTQIFGISMRGLSIKDCIAMASSISGPGGPSGLVEFNINGENLLQTAGVSIHPVSPADAQTWCSTVADGSAILSPVYSLRTTAP